MLRVDRAAIDTLARADSVDEVVHLVEQAVRLEFATIPPYLTAMLSLRPRTNRDIWWAIHDVVVDEMLHMLIGCNLLNALGRRPALDAADFVPHYPGPLPLGIGSGLDVGLEPFSLELVERVFMEIEEPENALTFPTGAAAADVAFGTIGEFYRALSDALTGLGADVFVGLESRQVVAPRWFPPGRLFAVRGVADAVAALDLVTAEGEGTAISPIDPDGDVAHYYRFGGIRRGHRLVANPGVSEGFSFTGAEYGFDPAGVWPLTPNQCHDDLGATTEAWAVVQRFRVAFTRLMRALQRTVDGDPGHLDVAMGLMFELKLVGQALAATPADGSRNVGPVFRWTDPTSG